MLNKTVRVQQLPDLAIKNYGLHGGRGIDWINDYQRQHGMPVVHTMKAVMDAERALGFEPSDVSADKCGYDVESKVSGNDGHLRFIEVKGRVKGAETVTVTKNEILTALNKPEQFILAIVEVDGEAAIPCYVRQPFSREPDFAVTSVNYKLSELMAQGGPPA